MCWSIKIKDKKTISVYILLANHYSSKSVVYGGYYTCNVLAFEYFVLSHTVLSVLARLGTLHSSGLPQDKNHFRGLPLQAPP